ncbi:MAG TPA: alpha/beta hydrolase fold domain-containing protein, partial [Novosphingobium sp.]|nr:alpha/beta hydrolase fold domain-containing protein [Novosphingobium sp.]
AFGREFPHLILCGDSAGGTLTCVTANALADRPASVPLLMQFPIYPMADSTRDYPSASQFGDGYGLPGADMDFYDRAYAADVQSPRHSAILGDLAKLPPTFVVTAGLDPLRDEGRAYAARCAEAGVQVPYREYAGTIHGCFTFRKAIPSTQADLTQALAIAKAMVAEALTGA